MSKNKRITAPSANCLILSETDDSHVSKATPFQTKKRQMTDETLGPLDDAGIDKTRQTWTRKQRGLKGNSAKAI